MYKNLILAIWITTGIISTSAQSFDKEKMDNYLTLLEENDMAMGGVVLSKNGEVIYEKYIGKAEIRDNNNRDISKETVFKVGSITKTFTAVIIQQLIEEEKLTLETPLAEFFPEIPNAERITISHLLYQRTGLHNFTDDEEYLVYRTQYQSKEQMLTRFSELDTEFEPGEQHAYSNTNYVLLGYLIEEITGKPYEEVLSERITRPLNLDQTYYGGKTNPGNNEAYSYVYQGGQWIQVPMEDMSVPHGAGAIVSTPGELVTFIKALDQGELISEASLAQMKDFQDGYGMGVFPLPFYDNVGYGHNGGIEAFQSNMAYFPKDSLALSALFNGLNVSMNDILIGILSIYYGKEYELPDVSQKPIELSKEELEPYAGDYTSEIMPLDIRIFVQENQLMAQATGQGAFPLTPFSKEEFSFKQAGIVILFDAEQDLTTFQLKQGGKTFLYKRK